MQFTRSPTAMIEPSGDMAACPDSSLLSQLMTLVFHWCFVGIVAPFDVRSTTSMASVSNANDPLPVGEWDHCSTDVHTINWPDFGPIEARDFRSIPPS